MITGSEARDALDPFVSTIVQKATDPQGNSLGFETHAIVSEAFYRLPTARSLFARRVAESLGLELIELRLSRVFTDQVREVAFVLNPGQVRGRSLIYIGGDVLNPAHAALLKAAGTGVITSVPVEAPVADLSPDPSDPLLREMLEELLLKETDALKRYMQALPDQRVFEILEACQAEGYDQADDKGSQFSANFELLRSEALARHQILPLEKLEACRLAIFDFDNTLAPTMAPVSIDMMRELTYLLESGTSMAIVTMQPMCDPGLELCLLAPMRKYLEGEGKATSLLQGLHLFPYSGLQYYRPNEAGNVDLSRPIYDAGLQQEQRKDQLEQIVKAAVGAIAKSASRREWISVKFKTVDQLQSANRALHEALRSEGMDRMSTLVDEKKCSLRVCPSEMLNKRFAFEWIMQHLAVEIPRREIWAAGDHMEEGGCDADLFVLGGVNIALGKAGCRGANLEHLKQGPEGILRALRTRREKLEGPAE